MADACSNFYAYLILVVVPADLSRRMRRLPLPWSRQSRLHKPTDTVTSANGYTAAASLPAPTMTPTITPVRHRRRRRPRRRPSTPTPAGISFRPGGCAVPHGIRLNVVRIYAYIYRLGGTRSWISSRPAGCRTRTPGPYTLLYEPHRDLRGDASWRLGSPVGRRKATQPTTDDVPAFEDEETRELKALPP